MVQSQERDGVGDAGGAVGIYKCCGCSEIWEPYFNMCEAARAHAEGDAHTHTSHTHVAHIAERTVISLQESGAFVCV